MLYDGNDIEIRNDLAWSEMDDLLNGRTETSTIAILTPENPLKWNDDEKYKIDDDAGSSRRNAENAERRKMFEDAMESKGLRLYSIEGSYGTPESSYIIPNMSLEAAIKVGKKYGQDSVIHGKKISTEKGSAMEYQMIYTSGGGVDSSAGKRHIVISGPEADSRNDLFSKYNGVKFYIPFYEEGYEEMMPQDLNKQQPPSELKEQNQSSSYAQDYKRDILAALKRVPYSLEDTHKGQSKISNLNQEFVATLNLQDIRKKLYPVRSKVPLGTIFVEVTKKLNKIIRRVPGPNQEVDDPGQMIVPVHETIYPKGAGDFAELDPDVVVRIALLSMADAMDNQSEDLQIATQSLA